MNSSDLTFTTADDPKMGIDIRAAIQNGRITLEKNVGIDPNQIDLFQFLPELNSSSLPAHQLSQVDICGYFPTPQSLQAKIACSAASDKILVFRIDSRGPCSSVPSLHRIFSSRVGIHSMGLLLNSGGCSLLPNLVTEREPE